MSRSTVSGAGATAAASNRPLRESAPVAADLSPLDLPYDFPTAPRDTSISPAARSRVLDQELAAGVERLTADGRGSRAAVLLTAWQVLLHRWTGQNDIAVGIGHAGQRRLVRLDTSGNPSFHGLLQRARETSADSLPEGGAQVEFGAAEEPAPAGMGWELRMTWDVQGDTMPLALHYDARRFQPETIDRLLGSYQTLLSRAVHHPDEPIDVLPVVPSEELRKVLFDWNATELPYDRGQCIHEAFARHVREKPEAIAVVGGEERWSYAQLDAAAERLSTVLQSRGVGPETLVGLHLPRTPWLLAGMLGILKAGGAYVPLDPSYPKERLQTIVADSRMSVLVTEHSLRGRIGAGSVDEVCVDDLPEPARDRLPPAAPKVTSSNLAYVIYTSGSTGEPKGVCLTHQAVAALVAWAAGLYGFSEIAGVLFATSASFDVSVFETLVPLCLGGKIIVAPNLLEIGRLAARDEIRLVCGVPSAMAEVVRARALPRSVITVNVAGEPCPQSLIDSLYELGHVRQVYDVYGPTETTVYSTGGRREAGGRPTIGRPLPNEQAYVLDDNFQPVPVGVRGELFIGGDKLARGYLNRPALTAERFLEVPALPGRRLYRTGDAVRWRADGTLEYLGRLDRQVKIRGFRVEPSEVEAVVRSHGAVADCAVVPRVDPSGLKILAAYIVGKDAAPDLDAIKAHVARRLPDHLVPSAFLALPALPRSPNGKLDVRQLPAPESATRRQRYLPPRDGLEQQLVRIWEEVLGVRPIGIEDRFLDLGGHSLLAARMALQLEQKFGQKIPVSILFRAPTVAALARAIREENLAEAGLSLVEIQPKGSRVPIFWLHTLGGDNGAGLFTYEPLSRHLGPDQPSYGLVAPPGPQPETLEEMAAFYAREIRTVRPHGPYILAGYCFGGVLAYEVARQLAAAGAAVERVILLDAAPPSPPGMPGVFSRAFARHLAVELPAWLRVACGNPSDFVRRGERVVRRIVGRVLRPFQPAKAPQPAPGGLSDVMAMEAYPAEFKAAAEAHWRALANYRSRPFAGRLLVLRTYRPRLLMYPLEFQWSLLSPHVESEVVPGNHASLLEEPQVAAVAAAINRRLA